MKLTDYKPGRRLDAMVAMCMGWRWAFPLGRILYPPDDSVELASIDSPLVNDYWDVYITDYKYSTNDGAALEAARDAGVLDEFSLCRLHTNGSSLLFDIERQQNIQGNTLAHCLCLGILAVQSEGKLAEYEAWLPEEVE